MNPRVQRALPDPALHAQAALVFKRALPALIRWFRKNARVLPWRRAAGKTRRHPYPSWVAEIMLQQTQVATATPHFERWLLRFPDVETLARASEAEVLRHWAGLGYYARARNLHQAAQRVHRLGRFPETPEELRTLPGVGEYTAGAVASLAFNRPAPILDGNVTRVMSRLFALDFLPGQGRAQRDAYWDLARQWAQGREPGDANEGLMELGALVCTPVAPRCGACPLRRHCRAQAQGLQASLPPPKPRPKSVTVVGSAFVARRAGQVLMEMRPRGSFLAGHFSFPMAEGGAPAKGFPFSGAKPAGARELAGEVRHAIMHRRYRLKVWRVECSAAPKIKPPLQWVRERDLPGKLTNSLARKIWDAARS